MVKYKIALKTLSPVYIASGLSECLEDLASAHQAFTKTVLQDAAYLLFPDPIEYNNRITNYRPDPLLYTHLFKGGVNDGILTTIQGLVVYASTVLHREIVALGLFEKYHTFLIRETFGFNVITLYGEGNDTPEAVNILENRDYDQY